ncbi:MAG: GlsB/YeaQ/YmgE family stress response membrane protein [Cucumibacter sp.]
MEGIGWIGAIIIGGIAGWIAERIMKGNHGLVTNIDLGILGAVLLNWALTSLTGSTLGGLFGQFVVAAVGACILIFLYRVLRGRPT